MLLRRGPLACHPCPDRRWCRFLSIHRTFDAVDRHAGWRASNWGANQRWGDLPVAEPASIEELQELVCKSGKVRCIGSAHSFTPLISNGAAESSAMQLISLRGMPRTAVIDAEQRTVTVDAGTTYSELCCFLASHSSELALPTTASLPHFSVAGAVATGTHGSSGMGSDGRLKLAGLADAVTALEIIGADGSVRTLTKEASKDFDCAVVSLGMLGVVTKLQLQLVPAYDVRQRVYGGWPPVAHQNEATGAGGLKRMLASYSEALQQTDSLSAFVMWDVDDPGMLICRDKLHCSSGEPLTAPPTAPTQWKDTGALLRHEPIEGFLEGFGAFDATSTGRWCDKMHSALAKHCRSPRPVASPCACLWWPVHVHVCVHVHVHVHVRVRVRVHVHLHVRMLGPSNCPPCRDIAHRAVSRLHACFGRMLRNWTPLTPSTYPRIRANAQMAHACISLVPQSGCATLLHLGPKERPSYSWSTSCHCAMRKKHSSALAWSRRRGAAPFYMQRFEPCAVMDR